jgi:hypothetical protein
MQIGIFTIPLRPTLAVYLGADGSISTGISTSLTQDLTVNSGVFYPDANGKVAAIFDPQFKKLKYEAPKLLADTALRAYIRPELIVKVFGEIGPYLSADGFVKLEAGATRKPQWELFAGVKCDLGLKLKIFNAIDLKMTYTFCEKKWPVAAAKVTQAPDKPTPIAPVTKSPPPSAGAENILIVFDQISATVINLSNAPLSLIGVTFSRIDSQGVETANFPAENWAPYAQRPVSALPPGDCFMINTKKSNRPVQCKNAWAFITTSNPKYHFWLSASGSSQFKVLQNGNLVHTCSITTGSCVFTLPQP